MRKEDDNARLNHLNIFNLDRLNVNDNFENGASATLGFDYEIKKPTSDFNFTIGQVIKDKPNNKMPDSTSLDNQFSDAVGNSSYKVNNGEVELSYNFALDQNYEELNYNEIGAKIDLKPIKFNFNYLQEKELVYRREFYNDSELEPENSLMFKISLTPFGNINSPSFR